MMSLGYKSPVIVLRAHAIIDYTSASKENAMDVTSDVKRSQII
jgi:hypothetical protein